jgi:hypothetical protein
MKIDRNTNEISNLSDEIQVLLRKKQIILGEITSFEEKKFR